ncbi:aminodeoxychorismate synthase component 1 [Erwinia sp. HR93]|nr:aminodeoxychorismate synthase component 1 [Erwinia sp. HR93]MEA1065223.1 aminodeoxychorismate synthase component 1 [Erwinia sp. HR93]
MLTFIRAAQVSPKSMISTASISPARLTLPWRSDAIEYYFSRVQHQPWAMMLHSGYAQHASSRFDIMVADPKVRLQTHGATTQITYTDDHHEYHNDDPFHLVTREMHKMGWLPRQASDIPFQGGALGLFGYDLGRRIEKIPTRAEADLHAPDMAIGLYDWALIADHHLQRLTLISYGCPEARLNWLNTQRSAQCSRFQLTTSWHANMSRAGYGERFRRIQAWLHSGDCYQVNLAQRFNASYQGDEWQAFVALNADNRAPFSAFLRLNGCAILSVSPERFIHLCGSQIETRPIKGTLPRLADAAQDAEQARRLAASSKDRAENLMIVDLLRNDIGRVAEPGSVRVPELFAVEPFPAVHHLVSTVTARLPPHRHATELLRAAFPGGSITGAPKIRAMEIIETLEPQRRNAWCGSIGYISSCGRMDTSITIRTLTAQDGSLYCSAGGGIVADSSEEAEYQETLAKVNRILRLTEKL